MLPSVGVPGGDNLRLAVSEHLAVLPLGFAETYLAHQLPDQYNAIVTPVGRLVLLLAFDWRLGLLSLAPVVLAFLIMATMTGKRMAEKMRQYGNALEAMSNEAVEYVRGIPVVKTFGQSVFSFKKFKATIDEYEKWVISYTKDLRLPMMFYTAAVNGVFAFLIAGGLLFTTHGVTPEFLLNLLFYIIITPVISLTLTRMMYMSESKMVVADALARIGSVLEAAPMQVQASKTHVADEDAVQHRVDDGLAAYLLCQLIGSLGSNIALQGLVVFEHLKNIRNLQRFVIFADAIKVFGLIVGGDADADDQGANAGNDQDDGADGAGVAAMEPLLLPGKKLTPVQLTGVKMQEYFETVLGQMERSTVDSMVTMGLALHEMLALCAQSILAQAETTSARQVILQAAETLRKNYQQELCLADLLAEAHMSKSYFLRLFRRYMGTTPYNYLVNFRITQAKELLVLTDHSVSEIAQEVGFGDASNFSTRFAKATGQSPLQYRKSALKSASQE